ncbi:hypothetical protein PIB30_098153, partial [Stylosanthes scabra]|nr:hypothetical protein [Stylosanthes scabra]
TVLSRTAASLHCRSFRSKDGTQLSNSRSRNVKNVPGRRRHLHEGGHAVSRV